MACSQEKVDGAMGLSPDHLEQRYHTNTALNAQSQVQAAVYASFCIFERRKLSKGKVSKNILKLMVQNCVQTPHDRPRILPGAS